MKNIAILVPSLTGGGAEKVAGNLSVYLSKKYNVHLIVYSSENTTYDYAGTLHDISSNRRQSAFMKLYSFFERIRKVRKIKKENNIDVSISFLDNANFVNILSKVNDKVITSVRVFYQRNAKKLYSRINYMLVKKLYNKSDYVTCVSEEVRQDLIDNYNIEASKAVTIYNPYNIELIQKKSIEEINEEYKSIYKKIVISNMGRLTYQKGQIHLIRAFAKLKESIENINLLIIGKGILENELKSVAEKLGVSDSVFFIGFQDNPLKYLAKSDLYVFPSKYEGFPNALCEAMACKLPVISSDCPSGPKEILFQEMDLTKKTESIVHADYGILIPVIDDCNDIYSRHLTEKENMLHDSMLELLRDQQLKKLYLEKSFLRAQDFSISSILNKWIELL